MTEPTQTRGDILADAFCGIASAVQRAAASTRDDYALAPPVDRPDALATVTGYAVSVLPFDHPEFPDYALFVELNSCRLWVVHDGGAGFDADGRPRVREQDRHPFPSLDDALALARRLAPDMTIGSRTATDVLRDTVAALTHRQDAAVRPLETPTGGDADTETPEDTEAAQADAQRRERYRRASAEADGYQLEGLEPHDYQDHATRNMAVADAELSPQRHDMGEEWAKGYVEGARLRDELAMTREALDLARTERPDTEQLRDERDRARRVAVALEQQIAAVAAELDAIDGDVHGKRPAVLAGLRTATHRIRTALNPLEDQ